jgi:large subunit ribosomal protein L10
MAIKAKKIQPSKAQAIAEEKKRIESVQDFIFTDYRGLTVEQISRLRKQLREKKASYHIVKNNFARIAFKDLSYVIDEGIFAGPTAVAYASGEPNEVAKVLFDFAKDVPAVKVKGGMIDRAFMQPKEIEAFSKLPGRNTLLAMFMGALRSPVQKLVYTLVALRDKVESAAPAAAPVAEAAAAPVADAAPAAEAPAAPAAEAPQA